MIDRKNPMPLYLQLRDLLREDIASGTYPRGSRLPTEQELSARYGLGRATVRSALEQLEREGLIEKRHGVGSFVRRREGAVSLAPLISLSGFLRVMGIHAESRTLRSGWIEPDDALRADARMPGAGRMGEVVRLHSTLGAPFAVETSRFSAPVFERLNRQKLEGSLARLLMEELGLAIGRVEQALFRRPAGEEERRLLGQPEGAQLLEMQRWLYLEGEETPFSYMEFLIASGVWGEFSGAAEVGR